MSFSPWEASHPGPKFSETKRNFKPGRSGSVYRLGVVGRMSLLPYARPYEESNGSPSSIPRTKFHLEGAAGYGLQRFADVHRRRQLGVNQLLASNA